MDYKWLMQLWKNLVRYCNTVIIIHVLLFLTEFSFLATCYNLLYQSLIPNCKLTTKILKQNLEIPGDVESFIVNGESSRIRCQRIINLLIVQLDATKDCKYFCDLFNMISVTTDLTDKLKMGNCYLYWKLFY